MSHFKVKIKKFDFGCGSAPDPAGGAYSAPPEPQLYLRQPTSKGGLWKRGREQEGKWKEERKGRGGRREGRGRDVTGGVRPRKYFGLQLPLFELSLDRTRNQHGAEYLSTGGSRHMVEKLM